MRDASALARHIVECFERHDGEGVRQHFAGRLQHWPVETYIDATWHPTLDKLAGGQRRIVGDIEVFGSPPAAKVTLSGTGGSTIAAFGFDDDVRLFGLVLDPPSHGIRNVVIGTPRGEWRNDRVEGEPRDLAHFYAEILGMKIVREDWVKIGRDRPTRPELAFGDGWSDERPPRWPDPEYPQQLHLDISVPDLDAAGDRVLGLGARLLQDKGEYRSYADLFGHPFCLYRDPSVAATEITRVVFDSPDPHELADFYAQLLEMRERVEESSDRVVIARLDGSRPMLGFQRSESIAPRWPDPAYPAQVHLDLYFDDGKAALDLALRLGAERLPKGGSCPVLADPAGHPFCVGSPHWS